MTPDPCRSKHGDVSITSSHCAVLSLSGQMMARVSSSSTSAAVPGRLPSPASLSAVRYFLKDQPNVLAPSVTWKSKCAESEDWRKISAQGEDQRAQSVAEGS